MPLFETLPINEEEIRKALEENWGLKLGKCLKSSQNHTFEATKGDDTNTKFIVRATPDPNANRGQNMDVEVTLLRFLKEKGLLVCKSIPTLKEVPWIRTDSSVIVVVFDYAQGVPCNLLEWKFMTVKEEVLGLGKWLAKFHRLSKEFSKIHPEILDKARKWDQLHDGVLKGVEMNPIDIQNENDPEKFGLIHGDVNVSNFFWVPSEGMNCMFDWDQLQMGWFLYDLSSPIWTVFSMKNGGSPVPDAPANVEQYTEWLLSGYEGESGETVDRQELNRMIELRRQLYKRFCSKAVTELDPDHPMAKFCAMMNSWLDKEL